MSDPASMPDSRPDRSNQPAEVQLVNIETTTNEEIESDILLPVVFSPDNLFCRFELEPKGFLSPNSSISIGVKPNSAVERAFFPKGVGVYSLIKRAVLKTSSGRAINDTDEVSHQLALTSMYSSLQGNKNREQFSTGRGLCYEMNYPNGGFTSAESYGLSNGKEYSPTGLTCNNFEVVSKSRPDLYPTFQLNLHELFPFLRAGQRIPLYMLGNDRLQIELFFQPLKEARMSVSKADQTSSATREFVIDTNSVQMIADHVYIPGGMEDWAEKHKEIQYGFTQMVSSRHVINTTNAVSNKRNVGGAGRLVKRVFTGVSCDIQKQTTADPPVLTPIVGADQLLNKYEAVGNLRDEDKHGKITTNVFMNEHKLFPQDVTNMARHYHNLRDATGRIIYTTRGVYCDEGGISTDTVQQGLIAPKGVASLHYEGRGQSDNLAGKQNFLGFRLNTGERVGTKGIELTADFENLRHTAGEIATYTQYSMIEVIKSAVLIDGQLEVVYA